MTGGTLSLPSGLNEITINSGLFHNIKKIVPKIENTLNKTKTKNIVRNFCSIIWKYLAFRNEEYNIHIQYMSLDLFLYKDKILFIKPIFGYPGEFYEYSISVNDKGELNCFRRSKSSDKCNTTGYWFGSYEDIKVDTFKDELEHLLGLLNRSDIV